jgi:hypothetical protein
VKPSEISLVSVADVVDRDPLLCSIITEAALRVTLSHRSISTSSGSSSSGSSSGSQLEEKLALVGNNCYKAGIAIDFITEATARAQAADQQAAGASNAAVSPLSKQLFSVLVAALKLIQCTAYNEAAADASASSVMLHMFCNRAGMFCSASSAVLRVLGDGGHSRMKLYALPGPSAALAAAGAPRSTEQQLLWFHLLGRSLVAVAKLLPQLPLHLTASGMPQCTTEAAWPLVQQYTVIGASLRLTVVTLICMHKMLQAGGAAAAAMAAGLPGAAATPAQLQHLLQQAAELQQRLTALHRLLHPMDYSDDGSWAGGNPNQTFSFSLPQLAYAMAQLRAACVSGELLQQLHSFGVACCAAFPQPGCCANPACTNLDKFTETALANRACKGCNKVGWAGLGWALQHLGPT